MKIPKERVADSRAENGEPRQRIEGFDETNAELDERIEELEQVDETNKELQQRIKNWSMLKRQVKSCKAELESRRGLRGKMRGLRQYCMPSNIIRKFAQAAGGLIRPIDLRRTYKTSRKFGIFEVYQGPGNSSHLEVG
jgi:hypothetical protein